MKPLLDLDTAAPDRHPIGITVEGERQIYMLRATEEYSTRERKRLSTLLKAVVEFEQSDEDTIEDADYDAYDAALSEVTAIAMPDLPLNVLHRLSHTEHGKIAALVVTLFTRTGANLNPETPEEETVKPTRLRALAGRLTLVKPSPVSAATTEDIRADG